MDTNNIVIGVLIEETTTYSLIEVCHKYHISEDLLHEMREEGLFSSQVNEQHDEILDQKALRRIESALRLHRDLRINLPGIVLTLDLLEKIERIQKELDILKKHF